MPALSWGFYGHQLINRKAVFNLPESMFGFYKSNIDYLERHAVDPDKRRYSSEFEAPRHYLDLDHYLDLYACDVSSVNHCLPAGWEQATKMRTEDTLIAYGILPWHLESMVFRLQKYFEEKDLEGIIKTSAEIGHYASDAHVPLHTTENYNGQLTGQHGIHALWESRIPENYGNEYLFLGSKAIYLDNVRSSIWKVILQSHTQVKRVLLSENEVRALHTEHGMYSVYSDGKTSKKDYSKSYIDEYHSRIGDLVQDKMILSAQFIASVWYTAWVNAGQPDLPNLAVESTASKEVLTNQPDYKEHER